MQATTPQPRRVGRAVAAAAALSLAVVGAPAAVMAQDDDVLKVATTAAITTWDPIKSFSTETLYMSNIYEPLIYAAPPDADEDFLPGLAESWEVSDDGLTWTFHLQEGVTFHDGEPFTAEAVKATVEAAKERGGAGFIWAPVESVEAVDDLTVQFNLSSPAAMELIAASSNAAWIVSPKALAAAAEDEAYFESGVSAGTGPYQIESWVDGSEVLLTKFDDYRLGWDDVDHYEKVLLSIIPEAVNQQQALDGGQVDLALRVPPESLDQYEANPDFTVRYDPSVQTYLGLLNTQRAPLDDPDVRRALALATPYEDIIEVGNVGYGVQSRATVPEGIFPYTDDIPVYETDLEEAMALMEETGAAPFDLDITYAAENPQHAAYAPLLAQAYGELGVNVTLTPMPWSQQWERSRGEPDGRQDMFLLLYWPTYSDAGSDNLVSLFRSSENPFFNLSYWADEEFDALVDEAVGMTGSDFEAAEAKYGEAIERLVDQSPAIFFYDALDTMPVPNSIAGYDYNINYPFNEFFYPLHPAE